MSEHLRTQIETLCDGLYYISETDAPIEVVKVPIVLADEGLECLSFEQFFARLTAIYPGHQEPQIARAKKFLKLKHLLEESLRDLAVYKLGEIKRRIYVVGMDENDRLVGITTEAVET